MKMEKHVLDVLKELKPKKINVNKLRNEKDFLFVRDKAKKILVLNHTAREIYSACNGSKVGEIIRIISSKYPNIDIERISIDVLICLRDLETRGLLALR
jgi:hypothetical protein